MMIPPEGFEGWKVWTVGDDIAWIKPGRDRTAARDQSGSGLFRRRAGDVSENEPQCDCDAVAEHNFHERGAHARRRRLVGRDDRRAAGRVPRLAGTTLDARDRKRNRARRPRTRTHGSPHRPRNAPPSIRDWEDPNGVPISAFIFGGRRASTIPLVFQAFNWSAGVYVGATMGSETTAAAAGTVGKVRRDPMAMLPFCGYHMGDYFRHWLQHAARAQRDAADFPRELVPQRRRRQISLAGVQREHAGIEVDCRSGAQPHGRREKRRSAGCRSYEDIRLGWSGVFTKRDLKNCKRSTARHGEPR